MSKKYKVIVNYYSHLKAGDIVTKVEGSKNNNLYKLPKHLHGYGHNGDLHLNLKEDNYIYLSDHEVEAWKNTRKAREEQEALAFAREEARMKRFGIYKE